MRFSYDLSLTEEIKMKVDHNEKNTVILHIDKHIYNITILHKCFYWYTSKFEIDIEELGAHYIVSLSKIPDLMDTQMLISDIKKNLIDFKTRDLIAQETADIKALLIAKAFANEEDFDELPPGDLNDPLGFNVFDY